MKKYLILLPILLFVGCQSSVPNSSPAIPLTLENKSKDAAQWVAQRSGFIEIAVSTITQVVVYSVVKDSGDQIHIKTELNTIATSLNALVNNGKVDPESVRQVLQINEPYFDTILVSINSLYSAEYQNLANNGYVGLAFEILKAVSKGIIDATA